MGAMSDRELKIKAAFEMFLLVAGSEHGDVYQLPYEGGVFNQPFKTAKMWALFKQQLVKHIAQENKKRAQKMKSRR